MAEYRFVAISLDEAIDEISERLRSIIERHGPRAMASYMGTYFFQDNAANPALENPWPEVCTGCG